MPLRVNRYQFRFKSRLEYLLIRKPVDELHFIQTKEAMSAVEIDLDTLPETSSGYGGFVTSALAPLAIANPSLMATVYVQHGPSLSFGHHGHSAFFGVAGDRCVLSALYTAFSNVSGIEVRKDKQIFQSQTLRQYHLEAGNLWCPEEEHVWYARVVGGDEEDEDDEEDCAPSEDDSFKVECVFPEEWTDTNADAEDALTPGRVELPARFRAARSDASIGSIVRNIEAVYGLPEGSVALRGPDKKALRSHASIRTLRKRWE